VSRRVEGWPETGPISDDTLAARTIPVPLMVVRNAPSVFAKTFAATFSVWAIDVAIDLYVTNQIDIEFGCQIVTV